MMKCRNCHKSHSIAWPDPTVIAVFDLLTTTLFVRHVLWNDMCHKSLAQWIFGQRYHAIRKQGCDSSGVYCPLRRYNPNSSVSKPYYVSWYKDRLSSWPLWPWYQLNKWFYDWPLPKSVCNHAICYLFNCYLNFTHAIARSKVTTFKAM